MQTLSIVEMLMLEAIEESPDEWEKSLNVWMHTSLLLSTIWGLGGLLDDDSRKTFDAFVKQVGHVCVDDLEIPNFKLLKLWKGVDVLRPIPTNINKIEVGFPSEGLLYDYCYFFKQKGFWRQWSDIAKMQKYENSSLEVPTIDTQRYSYLINMHIRVSHNEPSWWK